MWKLLPSLPTHKKIKICYLVHSKQFQFLIINFITFIEIKWESWNSQMSSIPTIFGFITFEIFKFALYVIGHQRRPSSRREKKNGYVQLEILLKCCQQKPCEHSFVTHYSSCICTSLRYFCFLAINIWTIHKILKICLWNKNENVSFCKGCWQL